MFGAAEWKTSRYETFCRTVIIKLLPEFKIIKLWLWNMLKRNRDASETMKKVQSVQSEERKCSRSFLWGSGPTWAHVLIEAFLFYSDSPAANRSAGQQSVTQRRKPLLPSPVSMRSALPYFCVFLAMVPMLAMWWRSTWEWDESDEYPVTSGGAEWFSGADRGKQPALTHRSHLSLGSLSSAFSNGQLKTTQRSFCVCVTSLAHEVWSVCWGRIYLVQ